MHSLSSLNRYGNAAASNDSEQASRLPAVFVSHGAPTLALDSAQPRPSGRREAAAAPGAPPVEVDDALHSHGATALRLSELGRRIGKPKAILIASAHWGTSQPMLSGAAAPPTIHDFGGFGQALYDIRYPAPGSPELAAIARAVLASAGIEAGIDAQRGLDHGAWVPLLHM